MDGCWMDGWMNDCWAVLLCTFSLGSGVNANRASCVLSICCLGQSHCYCSCIEVRVVSESGLMCSECTRVVADDHDCLLDG